MLVPPRKGVDFNWAIAYETRRIRRHEKLPYTWMPSQILGELGRCVLDVISEAEGRLWGRKPAELILIAASSPDTAENVCIEQYWFNDRGNVGAVSRIGETFPRVIKGVFGEQEVLNQQLGNLRDGMTNPGQGDYPRLFSLLASGGDSLLANQGKQ